MPVHRNRGIDAILVEQYAGRPVPVRVQRAHESVHEAASMLAKAGRSKHAELMILVKTQPDSAGHDIRNLSPKVLLVESVMSQIGQAIGSRPCVAGQASLFRETA